MAARADNPPDSADYPLVPNLMEFNLGAAYGTNDTGAESPQPGKLFAADGAK